MVEPDTFVEALLPHQAESGLVTRAELDLAQRWAHAIASVPAPAESWLDGWLSAALPFSFRYADVDSRALLPGWRREASSDEGNSRGTVSRVTWTDDRTGLKLTWELTLLRDFPALEWVLILENAGSADTPLIHELHALDLRLDQPDAGQAYIVHGAHGGRCGADDLMPFEERVGSTDITHRREIELGSDFPSSNRHLPFFNLETPQERGVLVGMGWSGTWQAHIAADGTRLRTQVGLKGARFVLRPGERIRTPRILLLFWQGRRLHGHNMLRQLLHKHYVPRLNGQPQQPLVSVNTCFTYHGDGGYLEEANEATLMPLVRPFVDLGAELFIIDAGWYGDQEHWWQGLGAWHASRGKYPRGFRPLSDPLAAAGVRFGLWLVCEVASAGSEALREHPEWIWQPRPDAEGVYRLALPEAREWFLAHVDKLVAQEGVTCYRQDYGVPYGDERAGCVGLAETQQQMGLYALWDELVRRHSDLVMEGCSGGGRRIDLETIARFHWHQKTDAWFHTESDQCGLYGANLYLPGGTINIYTRATDDYGAWSSFAGQFSLAWHPLDPDFPSAQAKQQVERYKRIRHLLSGDFYPLTPCSLQEPWIGYQFHRTDLDRGFALLFRRTRAAETMYPLSDTFRVRLRGLRPAAHYRAHLEHSDVTLALTGSDLAEGVDVTIGTAPGAEMLTYEEDVALQ